MLMLTCIEFTDFFFKMWVHSVVRRSLIKNGLQTNSISFAIVVGNGLKKRLERQKMDCKIRSIQIRLYLQAKLEICVSTLPYNGPLFYYELAF